MATGNQVEDKDGLLKEAAEALKQADRRVSAEKLAFSLVERGKIPAFQSYDAFQEKVASLLTQDLQIVEQAIELDVSAPELGIGKVASEANVPSDATEAFFHRLAND